MINTSLQTATLPNQFTSFKRFMHMLLLCWIATTSLREGLTWVGRWVEWDFSSRYSIYCVKIYYKWCLFGRHTISEEDCYSSLRQRRLIGGVFTTTWGMYVDQHIDSLLYSTIPFGSWNWKLSNKNKTGNSAAAVIADRTAYDVRYSGIARDRYRIVCCSSASSIQ